METRAILGCTDACRTPVTCKTCGKTKAPRGRSVPLEASAGYCQSECEGYYLAPVAGHLWKGEAIE